MNSSARQHSGEICREWCRYDVYNTIKKKFDGSRFSWSNFYV